MNREGDAHAMDQEIELFLDGLSPDLRPIVLALRRLIRETVPEAEETILWGGLSYHAAWVGGRVKGAICQIGTASGKVWLEFIHGVRLADPGRLLRGDRLSKRHLVIERIEEIERPEIIALIRDAIP